MKRYQKSLLALSSVLLAASCTDLDEKLYDTVPMDGYGQTDKEIATIMGAAYASLRGGKDEVVQYYPCSEFVFFLDECASDEACIPTRGSDWDDKGVYRDLQTHNWKADNKCFESYWKYCFKGITSVNSVIYQVDKSGLDKAAADKVKAELRGLRAYYYWLLLNNFGDVPIVTDFEQTELPKKSDRKEVFKFIETELTQSMENLPSGVIYARFTQNVAYTLLARLYLNAEVYTGTPRWQDCLDACEKVKGYALTDYFQNFITQNQSSPEIIFAIPYDNKQGTIGNYLNSMSLNYNQRKAITAVSGGWQWSGNGISAQPGLYSSFEEGDVRRESLIVGEQIDKATGQVVVTDKGNKLIYTEEIASINNKDDVASECMGARLGKYEIRADEQWERDHDWVLMRWAEVLMMKAEANLRLGFPNTGLPFVNEVRRRAGLDGLSELTLENLDQEWLHEFVFEGLRRTVNIRFGTYYQNWWEKSGSPYDANKASRVYPVPANILTLNPNLKQNPDYL